jgi:hypothetical protein
MYSLVALAMGVAVAAGVDVYFSRINVSIIAA